MSGTNKAKLRCFRVGLECPAWSVFKTKNGEKIEGKFIENKKNQE